MPTATSSAAAVRGLAPLGAKASETAHYLKLLANEHRLLIVCNLATKGEMAVHDLANEVGLSQSALSQHLARLRADGLVGFRREAQTLFYRVTDRKALRLLTALKGVFCP
jgi:DNA-binding transcriptional ArsR family regulator